MNKFERYFKYDFHSVKLEYFYLYIAIAAIVALVIVLRSESKYKLEMFFLSLYLLTGSLNVLLNFKIPGISFFEMQPIRVVYLLLLLRIIRNRLFSKTKTSLSDTVKIPWFVFALIGYILFLTISVLYTQVEKGYVTIIDSVAFIILIYGVRELKDQASYDLIGKSIVIGAIVSSVVSIIQITIDPYFLRIGDDRAAFGSLIRSNGIFNTEYFNSYYLIIAISWVLATTKRNSLKLVLVTLFALGVITSFQRMSWVILFLVLVSYLVYIQKISFEKLFFGVFLGLSFILFVSVFYYQDIMKSSLVKERLTDSVDGRQGYYSFVLNSIGDKPVLGFGDLHNEVYYENLLRITGHRERATAEEGDLHSGYFMAMFQYGIPAFICFLTFVILALLYYASLVKQGIYFMVPFMVSILFLIGNLTNTFLFLKYLAILFAIHIGIGMGIKQIQVDQLKNINHTS
ncbi:O-antigen ligase family protein [Zobellia roscoffensis]|uniref:O-antigen ligase family protein n=1 Tax=Zobellia roscoffensis TaxID=2779508 RepID=UPI00188D12AC|nr:O-antigen ligase family protein [Zobellia roscoffensis]